MPPYDDRLFTPPAPIARVVRRPRMTTRRWMVAVAVVAVALASFGPFHAPLVIPAILLYFRVTSRPDPVRPTTAILLALLTCALLWANLRPTVWQEEFGGGIDAPSGLDPITGAMFWRGWPLSPCMFCLYHGMRFHPTGIEPCILALDGLLFVVALLATKAASERCLRWLRLRPS